MFIGELLFVLRDDKEYDDDPVIDFVVSDDLVKEGDPVIDFVVRDVCVDKDV